MITKTSTIDGKVVIVFVIQKMVRYNSMDRRVRNLKNKRVLAVLKQKYLSMF